VQVALLDAALEKRDQNHMNAIDSAEESGPFREKLILGEISRKNMALHAYEDMIWKVRTGFLTVLFLGWGLLLKSIVDAPSHSAPPMLVVVMLVFSLGVAWGAFIADRQYIRRKFRVILALNEIIAACHSSPDKLDELPPPLLQIVGDNPDSRSQIVGDKPDSSNECSGLREATKDAKRIYVIPMAAVIVAALLLLLINHRWAAGPTPPPAGPTQTGGVSGALR
jgi:hypothetical protein